MASTVTQQAILTAYVLLERDGKVFTIRRANTGFMDGFYCPVAGKAHEGEDILVAAVRETQEEAGVTIRPKDLTLVHTGHRYAAGDPRPHWIDMFFRCTKWQGEPHLAEPEKSDKISWIEYRQGGTTDGLELDAYFAQVFSMIEKGEGFSTFGWNNEPRVVALKEAV